MKLHLVTRENMERNSFMVTRHQEPFFLKMWHYHKEMELVLTLKSTGTRFVGDSIEKFHRGDVVLIGKDLPHMWLNDDIYFAENSGLIAEDIVIHFKEEFLGNGFFTLNEMSHIAKLFEKAKRGILFLDIPENIMDQIEKITQLSGFRKTIQFLNILDMLANHEKWEPLSSEGFITKFNKTQNPTLDNAYVYIFENFNQRITLNDVAAIAKMNPSAFSRYFKQINKKTFSRYLNELRVGFACKQLIERKDSIASICYESGYNNISNFNRQFKNIMRKSPSEYLKEYKEVE